MPGIDGDEARRHDVLNENILRFVNVLSQETNNRNYKNGSHVDFLETIAKSHVAHEGLCKMLHTCAHVSQNIGLEVDIHFHKGIIKMCTHHVPSISSKARRKWKYCKKSHSNYVSDKILDDTSTHLNDDNSTTTSTITELPHEDTLTTDQESITTTNETT